MTRWHGTVLLHDGTVVAPHLVWLVGLTPLKRPITQSHTIPNSSSWSFSHHHHSLTIYNHSLLITIYTHTSPPLLLLVLLVLLLIIMMMHHHHGGVALVVVVGFVGVIIMGWRMHG